MDSLQGAGQSLCIDCTETMDYFFFFGKAGAQSLIIAVNYMMLLSLEFNKFHLIWGFVLNHLRDLKWSPKAIWNSVDLIGEPLKDSPGTLLMKSNLDLLFYEQVTGGFFFCWFAVYCILWHVDLVPFGYLDLECTKAHYSWARSCPVRRDELWKGQVTPQSWWSILVHITHWRQRVCFMLKYFRTGNQNCCIASYKI